jgi:transcriptional regulator GlxA family with amidase domain
MAQWRSDIRLNSSKKTRLVGAAPPRSNAWRIPQHEGVAHSLIYIANHHTRQIHVEDLLPVSAMSRRGLYKAFKKHLGRTPGEKLENARIEQAKKLIITGRCKLKEVAARCGYRSVNTFYVAFKRVVGTSPGKLRSQLRPDSAPAPKKERWRILMSL